MTRVFFKVGRFFREEFIAENTIEAVVGIAFAGDQLVGDGLFE